MIPVSQAVILRVANDYKLQLTDFSHEQLEVEQKSLEAQLHLFPGDFCRLQKLAVVKYLNLNGNGKR